MNRTDNFIAPEEFVEFLKSEHTMARVTEKEYLYMGDTFVKVPIADEVDLLYYQRNYEPKVNYALSSDKKVECEGIWNHATQTLYDVGYTLRKILEKNDEKIPVIDKEKINDTIINQLKDKMLDYVKENYTELQQSLTQEQRDNYYFAKNYDGGEDYIYEKNTDLPTYIAKPSFELNAKTLIDYIRGGESQEKLLNNAWNEYLEKGKEVLGFSIMAYETVKQTQTAIKNNPEHPLHKVKQIIDVMKNDCQTVNVTINKNNTLFSFKTEADALRRYNSYISTYRMAAQDRKNFEKTFGRNEDYNFHDIAKITYGKQVLYEDKNILPEKELSALAAIKAKGIHSEKNREEKNQNKDMER
jgi:hypothetical protein